MCGQVNEVKVQLRSMVWSLYYGCGQVGVVYLDISFWVLSSPESAKGDSQVSSSCNSTPRDHQSTMWVWPLPSPLMISGAIYSTVPQYEWAD